MTIKLSTGLQNKMLSMQATPKAIFTAGLAGGALAYADGGASADTITSAVGSFITAGFAPGDIIYTYDSTTAGNDLSGVTLTAVAAGTLTFATGSLVGDTSEAFAADTVVVCCTGGSIRDIFKDCVINVYTGTQPSGGPDAAVAGTLLGQITEDGDTFVAAAFDNGLQFGVAADGIIDKATGQTWQLTGAAAGNAGWGRVVGNAADNGLASTTLPRIDFSIGQTSGDMRMAGGVAIEVSGVYGVNKFELTLPEYYGA